MNVAEVNDTVGLAVTVTFAVDVAEAGAAGGTYCTIIVQLPPVAMVPPPAAQVPPVIEKVPVPVTLAMLRPV